MGYYFDLVWHFLSSNSRHGTHSPFVYKLATDVIYHKGEGSNQGRSEEVLKLKVALFLKSEMITIQASDFEIKDLDISKFTVDEIIHVINKDKVVILTGVYKDKQSKNKWSALKVDQNVVVTIDLFHFAVLIVRKEQPKENFKLRFPYFK